MLTATRKLSQLLTASCESIKQHAFPRASRPLMPRYFAMSAVPDALALPVGVAAPIRLQHLLARHAAPFRFSRCQFDRRFRPGGSQTPTLLEGTCFLFRPEEAFYPERRAGCASPDRVGTIGSPSPFSVHPERLFLSFARQR